MPWSAYRITQKKKKRNIVRRAEFAHQCSLYALVELWRPKKSNNGKNGQLMKKKSDYKSHFVIFSGIRWKWIGLPCVHALDIFLDFLLGVFSLSVNIAFWDIFFLSFLYYQLIPNHKQEQGSQSVTNSDLSMFIVTLRPFWRCDQFK